MKYLGKHKKHKSQEAHQHAAHAPAKRRPKRWVLVAAVVLAVAVTAAFFMWPKQPADEQLPPVIPTANAVKVDFYVMSQCPFGTQVIDQIAPVKELLGDALDLNIEYILYPATQYAGQEAQYCIEELCSMHGIPEVRGDIVQLCAMKHAPANYLDMLTCQNKDMASIPDNWEQCAMLSGIDVSKVRQCYEGSEGLELLRESAAVARSAGATGSPTIYVAGQSYSGGRSENDFLRAICSEYQTDAPEPCSSIPEPVSVPVIVLNDVRCEACDVSPLLAQLEAIFPGMTTTVYDYSSAEGKRLYTELGLQYLPALLFDESVEQAEGYSMVGPYLEQKGQYTSLRIGAQFDPAVEICDNGIDDTGNGLIDCDDPDCQSKIVCNPDFFEECSAGFGVSPGTVLFYYSNSCGWCDLMKPAVQQLQDEGYSFQLVEAGNAAEEAIIDSCYREYMSGGVPQFVCAHTGLIKVGAFTDASRNADVNALRAWADACRET